MKHVDRGLRSQQLSKPREMYHRSSSWPVNRSSRCVSGRSSSHVLSCVASRVSRFVFLHWPGHSSTATHGGFEAPCLARRWPSARKVVWGSALLLVGCSPSRPQPSSLDSVLRARRLEELLVEADTLLVKSEQVDRGRALPSAHSVPGSSQLRAEVEEERARLPLDAQAGALEHLARAHAILSLAGELEPDDARVADGFGCIAFRLKRWEEAEGFFREALRRNGSFTRAAGHLALTLSRRGGADSRSEDSESVRQMYRRGLDANPLDAETRNNMAVFLSDVQEPEASVRELRKAVATGGRGSGEAQSNLEILNNLGAPMQYPR